MFIYKRAKIIEVGLLHAFNVDRRFSFCFVDYSFCDRPGLLTKVILVSSRQRSRL